MKKLIKQITVRFDEDLWKKVTALANKRGISFSEYARNAVDEMFLRIEETKKSKKTFENK